MRPARSSTMLALLLSLMPRVHDGLVAAQEPPPAPIDEHERVALAYLPDGKAIATSAGDGTVILRDVTDGHRASSVPRPRRFGPRWRSAPTARLWPPAAMARSFASGTSPPGRSGPS